MRMHELEAAAIDAQLQHQIRLDAQLRLRMGELLDALFVTRGHHELGFSSINGYGVERAGENARWCEASRALARRLRERGLAHLRGAVVDGRVSFSMAELLSRHATRDSERELIASAAGKTVRAMQLMLSGNRGPEASERACDGADERRTRRRLVTRGELAMLSVSRMLVSYLSNEDVSDESFVNAILGEAESDLATWRERLERSQSQPGPDEAALNMGLRHEAARRVLAELLTRSQSFEVPIDDAAAAASTSCDHRASRAHDPRAAVQRPVEAASLPSNPVALDRAIRALAAERSKRAGDIAAASLRFLEHRLWRRLGFRSLAAYALARPGLCLSTLEHQATLGRHLRRYPALARGLEAGKIGTEAALLIGRVLGRSAELAHAAAWIERAGARTYRRLREEVLVVLTGLSFDRRGSRMPPGLEALEDFAEIERKVQSGELFRSLLGARNPGPQASVTFIAHSGTDAAAPPLSLRLSDEVHVYWRGLEAEFHALAGHDSSFVAFMCLALWRTWQPFLEAREDKWADVYRRDRHRCQNPVCGRRDITPHHIVFQAHGGGDEKENVVSLCSWCHLQGVHRGRIAVWGRAPKLSWRIGRA